VLTNVLIYLRGSASINQIVWSVKGTVDIIIMIMIIIFLP